MADTDVPLLSLCNEILAAQWLFHFVIVFSENSNCLAWPLLLHRLLLLLGTICRRNTPLGPSCSFPFFIRRAVAVIWVEGSYHSVQILPEKATVHLLLCLRVMMTQGLILICIIPVTLKTKYISHKIICRCFQALTFQSERKNKKHRASWKPPFADFWHLNL